ncbi:hypothetical protein VTI74DRAFT_2822 [Chaetomium olivicolor]
MQLKTLLLSALLPLGLMANPAPEAEAEAGETLDARGAIVRPQYCKIVGGATQVNCRTGPRTKDSVRTKLDTGRTYAFWCVQKGECVTINGATNCGWHYRKDANCFVNGHYTDNSCTLARLGSCDWDDGDSNTGPFP